ncbi:MAG: hypothetical protein Q8N18_07855 [Opitutaceae bacterium]|nr:hypothetical protein [Opitutaceae bacterium]
MAILTEPGMVIGNGGATPRRPADSRFPSSLNHEGNMTTTVQIVPFLLTALVAAALAGVAMELVMGVIARVARVKGNMILALGSLLTKRREQAFRVGLIVHATAAVAFGVLYTLLMVTLGLTAMPISMMLGLGVGVLHGIVFSLMLVWVVADQHPLEEFKEADLLVGLSHLAGHAAFGAVVGVIVGVSPI